MNLHSAIPILTIPAAILFASCSHSSEPSIQLPDTTSHNFSWEKSTLGDGASSILYDVAIINDTLAYAVGAIYLRDSLGNWDPNAYNAVKWNGQKWELKRIPFIGPCSAVDYPPLRTIWGFSPSDILVTNGGSIVRYDGVNSVMDCGMSSMLTGAINKIWANDPRDVYAFGNAGAIVHYTDGIWQALQSGTTLDITDVYGARYAPSGDLEILAVASKFLISSERRIMQISGTTVGALSDNGINYSLRGIWFVPGVHYYAVGSGIYEKHFLQDQIWSNGPLDITSYHTYAVRGTAANDVFVCGDFGEILHFNGSTWHSYLSQTGLSSGAYYALSARGDQVIAVGQIPGLAVVARGKRVK